MNAFACSYLKWLNVLAACLFVLSTSTAFSITRADFSAAADESKTPTERIEMLYRLLHEEIKSPAKPVPAFGGGEIDHDTLLFDVAAAMQAVTRKAPSAKAVIREKFNRETNADAKQILALALGMSGDKSGLKEMIQALKRKDRNCLRYFTATALADSGALVAIPDLIEALKDPWQAPRGSEIGEYPVREAAALALLGMGVDVTTPAGISLNTRTQPSYLVQGKAPDATELGDYRAVKGDAVRAIAKELASKDSETVAMAIKAIARVGGSEAKAELERFISENAGKPLQSLYVTIARECLSQIKP